MPPAYFATTVDPFLLDLYAEVDAAQSEVPPADRYLRWAPSVTLLAGGVECETSVDEYRGPQGRGWAIVAKVVDAGATWVRLVGFGPESRDKAWTRIPASLGG